MGYAGLMYWGMLLVALTSAVVIVGGTGGREQEQERMVASATFMREEGGWSSTRVELLSGVGCEGEEVVVRGFGEEARVEGGRIFMGAGFFDGKWTMEELCGVYWHERGHLELGHTEELGEIGDSRRIEQELEADAYGQRELARRGGGLCGLHGALIKVYNRHVVDSASYPPRELRLRRLREWGGCT